MEKAKYNNVEYLKILFNKGVIDICTGEKNSFFITINGSFIKLSEKFYEVLKVIKYEHDLEKIKNLTNSKTFENLCDLLRKKESSNDNSSYIYFKIKVINGNIVNFISSYLSILFYRRIFKYLLPLSIIFNFIFYYFHFQNYKIDFSTIDLLVYYIILISIMIMHEFGHAAACKYHGIQPSDIGFGFYIFFPVFFANVTNIWILSKNKRIIVNVGGIYFQLIINLLLIIISYYYNNNILTKIINVNLFVACYSLIPFLRNDGYWIYSDYFNIPNLSTRSRYYSINIITDFIKRQKRAINYPLFIYSIGNSLFLFFIVFNYLKILRFNINTIFLSSDNSTIMMKGFVTIVTTFFFIIFLKRYLISFLKQVKIYFYGETL